MKMFWWERYAMIMTLEPVMANVPVLSGAAPGGMAHVMALEGDAR